MARYYILLATVALLALTVTAHGDEEESGMSMGMDMAASMNTTHTGHNSSLPAWEGWEPSYFRYGKYTGWMTMHILAMIASWVIIMPVALMLSVARSRYSLPSQLLFHAMNGFGLFAGFVYNQSTPDLYVVNAHHPLGWAVQCMTILWTFLSVCVAFNSWRSRKQAKVTSSSARPLLDPHQPSQLQQYLDQNPLDRFSQDSGNFTNTRSNSYDSAHKDEEQPLSPGTTYEEDEHAESKAFSGHDGLDRMLTKHFAVSAHIVTAIRAVQIILEKFLLLLGFAALVTGFVTYGGIFRSQEVFSGAAHYVKGAIFFWYGLLTLARWAGAFAEFGWAWNLRPQSPAVARWKGVVPSAEFTESFVIWFYGASNVFLEHLGSSDSTWSPQDFEHVSITVLFFGGGLLGMLIEQRWLRKLMSVSVEAQGEKGAPDGGSQEASVDSSEWAAPKTECISLNPMPAITIMLLGSMMSGHHQLSMVSTMMHKQWGTLFSGFALARLVTYVVMYLKPPTSHYPSRPPSELIAAFCLTSGGLLFMNSARDSVRSIETNGLDAMTIFTITMGLTGLILAWEMGCLAIKGWAQRVERSARARTRA